MKVTVPNIVEVGMYDVGKVIHVEIQLHVIDLDQFIYRKIHFHDRIHKSYIIVDIGVGNSCLFDE